MDLNSCFKLCLLEKPKIFRVMYKDNFQEWRPHIWQSIERDYGLTCLKVKTQQYQVVLSQMHSLNQALAPLKAPWRR